MKRSEEYPEGDFRRGDPRFQGKNFDANIRVATRIREMADAKKATPAQIALAWLLHKGNDIVPIPGTKRRKFLEENIRAAELCLSAADMKELNDSLPPGVVAGSRYNNENMSLIDR